VITLSRESRPTTVPSVITGGWIIPSRSIYTRAVHTSAWGRMDFKRSMGIMAWPADVVGHSAFGTDLIECSVSRPSIRPSRDAGRRWNVPACCRNRILLAATAPARRRMSGTPAPCLWRLPHLCFSLAQCCGSGHACGAGLAWSCLVDDSVQHCLLWFSNTNNVGTVSAPIEARFDAMSILPG
jgi:hypothetical protein